MKQERGYQYRCYPTPGQSHTFARTFGCARFVYNWGLRLRTDAYRQRGQHLFYRETSAALTTLKQQEATVWLNEVSHVPTQQALRHLDKAFRNFFDGRAKYPTSREAWPPVGRVYDLGLHLGWQAIAAGQDGRAAADPVESPLPEGARPSTITVSKAACRALLRLLPGRRRHPAVAGLVSDGRDRSGAPGRGDALDGGEDGE